MPKRMKLAAFCLTFSTLCHPAFGTDQSAEYDSIRCSAPSLRVVHHEEAPVNFQHDRNGNKHLERILKILTSRKNCEPNILAIQEHSGSINYILLDTANFTIVFIGSEGADFESLFATPKEKKARDGILGHDHQYLGIMNIQGKTEELLQKSEEDGLPYLETGAQNVYKTFHHVTKQKPSNKLLKTPSINSFALYHSQQHHRANHHQTELLLTLWPCGMDT